MHKLSEHQKDNDASKVLQQDAILSIYVTYAEPSYDNKGIRYVIKENIYD